MTSQLETTPTCDAGSADPLLSDERLMEMIQGRDRNALSLLSERYGRLLTKVSSGVLRDQPDVEDVLQEVLAEIWNQAARYDVTKGRPIAWLVTLTRRRSIDRARKRDAYLRAADRFAEEVKSHSDCWTHVHEDIAQGERREYLGRALADLPAAQRNAIQLAYHGHMTQREIAAHTGLPLGTVKTRLQLGLQKMALFLRGFEDLLGDAVKPLLPHPSAVAV